MGTDRPSQRNLGGARGPPRQTKLYRAVANHASTAREGFCAERTRLRAGLPASPTHCRDFSNGRCVVGTRSPGSCDARHQTAEYAGGGRGRIAARPGKARPGGGGTSIARRPRAVHARASRRPHGASLRVHPAASPRIPWRRNARHADGPLPATQPPPPQPPPTPGSARMWPRASPPSRGSGLWPCAAASSTPTRRHIHHRRRDPHRAPAPTDLPSEVRALRDRARIDRTPGIR